MIDAKISILLGFIQGLTEFLPVSSSAHLVLIQNLIPNFSQPGILFDVVLHFGTLFSVLLFFRKQILSINLKYLMLIAAGTVPAVLAGLLFRKSFEVMFSSIGWLGVELMITGVLNIMIDKPDDGKKVLNYRNSLLIGVAQAISIIPGISRSGATIFTGVKLGISKEKAAEFSFLLSVPAILGANILEFLSHREVSILPANIYILGFLTALLIGYVSINLVYRFLKQGKFKLFGYYAILLGLVTILLF